jgi:holo-[acyl-carrier protein] synthase
MQIVGIGMDMVGVDRLAKVLERRGERFRERLLSQPELDELRARNLQGEREAEFLAGRWAAKEAVAKALGTGLALLGWSNIQILGSGAGPLCAFRGEAVGLVRLLGVQRVLVTITHESGIAAACAVAMGQARQALDARDA